MNGNFIQFVEGRFLDKIGRTLLWKVARMIIGLTPMFATMFFIVHVVLLIKGYDYELAYVVCSYSFTGFLAWIVISFAFQFSYMHRAFITYNYLVSFCIDFQREVGFGSWLMPARWFVLSIGLLVVAELVRIKLYKNKV